MDVRGNTKLKEILIRGSYLSEEDLKQAEKKAEDQHADLDNVLLQGGLLTKDLLGQALAESWGVPYSDLNSNMPLREQVLEIPEKDAREYRIVLFSKKDDAITVATDYPAQEGLKEKLVSLFPGK